MSKYHTPVMLNESLEFLNIKPDGNYVDGTLGEGGHSHNIFQRLVENGHLTSFDHDTDAISYVESQFKAEFETGRWEIVRDNFSKMLKHIEPNSIDGILMDLGLSSRHIDIPGRGFSFNDSAAPLDMRMDDRLGVTAADLLNALDQRQLSQLFIRYADERFANRIASFIKNSPRPIVTVGQLKELIDRAVPAASSDKNSVRRVFQALRIAVNDELQSLEIGLEASLKLLRTNGRLVVISFHSLEDRIVKHFINDHFELNEVENLTKKPIVATEEELSRNKRSHSAKLRACRKL